MPKATAEAKIAVRAAEFATRPALAKVKKYGDAQKAKIRISNAHSTRMPRSRRKTRALTLLDTAVSRAAARAASPAVATDSVSLFVFMCVAVLSRLAVDYLVITWIGVVSCWPFADGS